MHINKIIGEIGSLIRAALKEDCPENDITTNACVDPAQQCRAVVKAKQDMVLAGIPVFCAVMKEVDKSIRLSPLRKDGQRVHKGDVVLKIHGKCAAILRAERVALNYLQRMCGIATLTARYVEQVSGAKAKVLDTRKTTPNMRLLEKYAVTCGGGYNHRMDLSDQPLIKENHIRAAGGITAAVRMARKSRKKPLILEVTDRREALEGLAAGADILLLDNMTPRQAREIAKLARGKALIEVSGGVTLKTARQFALAGADRISVGALTHSAPAADLSLLFE